MRREPPVRIREGLGVKFPRATRLVICWRGTADEAMTVSHRVRQWLCVKIKVRGQGTTRFPDQHLYRKLGLYRLQRT